MNIAQAHSLLRQGLDQLIHAVVFFRRLVRIAQMHTVVAAGQVAPPEPNVAGTNTVTKVINGNEMTFIPVNKLNAKHRSDVY